MLIIGGFFIVIFIFYIFGKNYINNTYVSIKDLIKNENLYMNQKIENLNIFTKSLEEKIQYKQNIYESLQKLYDTLKFQEIYFKSTIKNYKININNSPKINNINPYFYLNKINNINIKFKKSLNLNELYTTIKIKKKKNLLDLL